MHHIVGFACIPPGRQISRCVPVSGSRQYRRAEVIGSSNSTPSGIDCSAVSVAVILFSGVTGAASRTVDKASFFAMVSVQVVDGCEERWSLSNSQKSRIALAHCDVGCGAVVSRLESLLIQGDTEALM